MDEFLYDESKKMVEKLQSLSFLHRLRVLEEVNSFFYEKTEEEEE